MSRTEKTRPGRGTGTGIKVNGQQTTAEHNRANTLRGCAAAYRHLERAGLVSHLVVDELRRILREAAP